MKKLISISKLALMVSVLLVAFGCDKNNDILNNPTGETKTIAAVTASNPQYSILADVLTKTGLADTLNNRSDEFTVFAPTNEAITAFLNRYGVTSIDGLISVLGPAKVRSIFLYHFIAGKELRSADITPGWQATAGERTAGAGDYQSLYFKVNPGVFLNGDSIQVITPDIVAANGVIHQINGVLVPLTLAQIVSVDDSLSTLQTAIDAASSTVSTALKDTTDLTLYAPNNAAFSSLLTESNAADLTALLTTIGGQAGLTNILQYHVVPGNVRSNQITAGTVNTALVGKSFVVSTIGGVTITDARARVANVTRFDIQGSNGVAHVLDKVLLPQ